MDTLVHTSSGSLSVCVHLQEDVAIIVIMEGKAPVGIAGILSFITQLSW